MARNKKTGLDYFPFDVDFFDDDKVKFVAARFGIKGQIIAIRLLCKIYKTTGYYYQWGEDEALLFSTGVGDGVQHSLVNDVVHELVKRGFFDKSIFDTFKILTSNGIQTRYEHICKGLKRSANINTKYDCRVLNAVNSGIIPEEIGVSSGGNEENSGGNDTKERKGKEKKGKGMEDLPPPPTNLDFYSNYETVKKYTVDDELFINQACVTVKAPNQEHFKAFALNKIRKMEIAGTIGKYTVSSIRSFIMSDFEKQMRETPIKNPPKLKML